MFNSKFIELSGTNIWYQTRQLDSRNPWVVFLHGAGLDHHMFDQQLSAVPDHYNILMWDARAHGRSKPNHTTFSMQQLLDDLIAILQVENIDQAIFVGQSMGGNLAQEIAYYHPEKTLGLILIDTTHNTGKISRMEKILIASTRTLLNLYPWQSLSKASAVACSLTPAVQDYATQCFKTLGKKDFVDILTAVTQVLHEDTTYTIPVPFLLLVGDQDKSGNILKIAPSWIQQEPHGTLHIIPDAAHNSNQDNPTVVNKLLQSFLLKMSTENRLNKKR